MEQYDQDTLLIVQALRRLAEETPNDIMREHAWALAEEFAGKEWLTIEDAVQHLRYDIEA